MERPHHQRVIVERKLSSGGNELVMVSYLSPFRSILVSIHLCLIVSDYSPHRIILHPPCSASVIRSFFPPFLSSKVDRKVPF